MITDLYKYIHVNVAIDAQGVCILFGTSLQRAPQTSLSGYSSSVIICKLSLGS